MAAATPEDPDRIRVEPVEGGADLGRFIRMPGPVYRGDAAWVAPLHLERRLHLGDRNPYFQHAEWRAWLALRDGRPVGRISAQVDHLHRERYGADTGHFGLLEGEDDPEVFRALFAAAEGWLAERGTRRVSGPFNLSVNQECGLLVEGFDDPPMVMMPHNPPWYAGHLEALGYAPLKDLLAYRISTDFTHPRAMQAVLRRYTSRIRLRPLERRRLDRELVLLRQLFNDAWAGNWGFVPFTEAEFADLGETLKLLVPEDYVQIAELDGEPAAFIVGLPNLNEAIRDLNGRLLPLGWLRLLWRLKGRRLRSGRVALMGVLPRLQGTALGSALAFSVIAALQPPMRRDGVEWVEMSWILEDNAGMRAILEVLGTELYKRYRLYGRTLGETAP